MNRAMSLLRAAGLAIILGSYAGCNPQPNAPVPQVEPLYLIPYGVGNEWITRSRSYDQQGRLTEERRDTSTVVGSLTIAGEEWYKLYHYRHGSTLATSSYLGAWSRPHLDSAASLVYRFPTRVGDTCATSGSSLPGNSSGTTNLIVTSADSLVTVPAGTFRCVVYHRQERSAAGTVINAWDRGADVDWDYYYCISPGVGMVKCGVRAKRWRSGVAVSTSGADNELVSFRVK